MSENTYHESSLDDDFLEEAKKYVIATSKGNQKDQWERVDRVMMRGVDVMYKMKNMDEVIIQSKEQQVRILEMHHSDPTSGHYGVKKTFNWANAMQKEVSTTVWRQLVTTLHNLRPRMTMTKVCVQQQTGGSDCGLFAIAFAVALVHKTLHVWHLIREQCGNTWGSTCRDSGWVPFPQWNSWSSRRTEWMGGRSRTSTYTLFTWTRN